jgi:hypothetical protein
MKRGEYDNRFLVREDGPEGRKGYRVESGFHGRMCSDAGVARERPSLSLE